MMSTTHYARASALPAIAAALALTSTTALAQQAPSTPPTTTAAQTATAPSPGAAPGRPAQSAVKPIVDLSARPKPTTAPATAAAKPAKTDETLPIAAGGALALLALGGAAFALTRRRKHEDEWVETSHEPAATTSAARHDPVIHDEQPAIVAPSAFAWGSERRSDSSREAGPMVDEDDRLPGESWVQRAYRGPTPNNPSVSLRSRLKRAAFFDKRERDVAAGTADPVEMDAGLPEAMVEEQERELA
jgi:hypothetical protein